jgi:dihydrofolate reductase
MSINIVIATGINGEVGQSNTFNGLPWHNPEDMAFFRRKTEGNVVVMGRKTFDALPFENGLPDRDNLVITSDERKVSLLYDEEFYCQIETFDYVEQSLQLQNNHDNPVFIVGGVSIYNQLNKYADTAYITRIDREYPDADAHIDLSWLERFELVDTETLNEYSYVETYKRKE